MKYELYHVYDENEKEYHDYYHLIDVVNSMSADRFVRNVKHAVALTMFKSSICQSSYSKLSNAFVELRKLSDKDLRKEYYLIKTAEDRHLIGKSIYVFGLKAANQTHYVSVHLSVQVINKQLKFIIAYFCTLPNGEEVQTSDLDELYHKIEDWNNHKIREDKNRRKQLKADLRSLGFYNKKYNKKPKHTAPQVMSMNEFENKLNELGDLDKIRSPFEDDWI
jgi:hypothetical protein